MQATVALFSITKEKNIDKIFYSKLMIFLQN